MTEPIATDKFKDELTKLKKWYEAACSYEKEWRYNARMWFDYFHGDQLTKDVIAAMRARSQPPIKYNLIKSIVNLLTGQEIQGRTDIQFLGYENGDDVTAKTLTEIYRQQGNSDNFAYEVTASFQDGVIGGRGCLFEDWCDDEEDIVREYVDWKEVYVDPASKRPDFSDARHIFRVKWVDEDVARDLYPDAKDLFDSCKFSGESERLDGKPHVQKDDYFDEFEDNAVSVRFYDSDRSRVKIIECWWKEGSGKKLKVMNGIFCEKGWLKDPEDFGRKHKEFPILFTYYDRDSYGVPYGLVKDLVDPQDVINRMISKSMHILGTKQILAEKGALKNTIRIQDEIAKPDAVINDFEDGSLSGGRVIINDNRTDAGLAFNHFEQATSMMHRISGVNPELQGLHTNARSGTAISMRLRQGNTVLTKLYDCLEKTKKGAAKLYVYLMSQYIKDERIARYKKQNGELEEVKLNSSEMVYPEDGGEPFKMKVNNLEEIFKYDIAITDAIASGNQDQADFVALTELFKVVPQAITPMALGELIKSTNLPNKEALAQALMPQQAPGGDATATSLNLN